MPGFLVRGGRFQRAVSLHEDEPGGIILLLQHIELGNAGFLDAVPGILSAGFLEGFDAIRFDVNVHVNNEHGFPFDVAKVLKRGGLTRIFFWGEYRTKERYPIRAERA
jgi:hypothetical protein